MATNGAFKVVSAVGTYYGQQGDTNSRLIACRNPTVTGSGYTGWVPAVSYSATCTWNGSRYYLNITGWGSFVVDLIMVY